MMKGSDSSPLVYLNVGGKKFCTYNDTLTRLEPNSMLATMFSRRHTLTQDQEGYTFIDRDGEYFGYILSWLRDGDVRSLEDSKYPQLLKEARYFQLQGLINVLDNKRKEKLGAADLTRTDIIKLIIQNHCPSLKKFNGVNVSGLDLSGLDLSNVDFSYACMKNVCFSNANLSYARFDYVDAKGANFNEANLYESSFVCTNLEGVSEVGAKNRPYSFVRAIIEFII